MDLKQFTNIIENLKMKWRFKKDSSKWWKCKWNEQIWPTTVYILINVNFPSANQVQNINPLKAKVVII